jgi:hypothetical protein
MLRPRIAWVPFLFPVLLFACVPGSLRAQTEIDLALVLAVDASRSMDPDERELQRQGYVEAFRSPMLHRAIQRGVLGQVAVTYIDWSDASDQRIVVPWTLIRQPDEALNFAERLAGMSMQRVLGSTSISGAIDFSRRLLMASPFAATRKVIDISGDGANNRGRPVTEARDEAIAQGITINGLALMLKRPEGPFEIHNVDDYYRDCVIGGLGAFMMAVREGRDFAEAIKAKIIREITNPSAVPTIQKTSAQPRVNCLDPVNQ